MMYPCRTKLRNPNAIIALGVAVGAWFCGFREVGRAASGRYCSMLVIAVFSLSCAGAEIAVATQWGSPTRALPFTLPCCVLEMAIVDLNGDGLPDVVAASGHVPTQNTPIPIQILLNDGHGGFTDGTSQLITGSIPQTIFPRKIVIADFNGDGRPDIFIADTGYDANPYPGAQSTLLLSTPDGHYVDATANLPQQLAYTHSAAAADIDGSGHLALYLGNLNAQNHIVPQLLLNDGTGHFTISSGRLPAAQTDYTQNAYTQALFVDVNGDGCPDLILGGVAFSGPPIQSYPSDVLINNCQGTFTRLAGAIPAKQFSDGVILDIEPISLDGTGSNDLLLTSTHSNYTGRAIQVLINNGSGIFQDQSTQRLNFQQDTGDWIEWSLLTDTTGQCRLDIFPTSGAIDANIFLNNGNGTFTQQATGLPTVFGLPYPIDQYGIGQTGFISLGGDGYYVTPVVSGSRCKITPTFTASPTAGPAPLAVTFTASGLALPMTYTTNFGDGTTGALTQSSCIGIAAIVGSRGGIQCSGSASHTYTAGGSYTATLLNALAVTVGAVAITVTGGAPNVSVAAPHKATTVGSQTIPALQDVPRQTVVAPFAGSNAAVPTISSFTASPASIAPFAGDGSATLSWSVASATSLSISGLGVVTGNSIQVSPSQTTTYTLTASDAQGAVTAQTTVTVAGYRSRRADPLSR